MQRNPWSNTQRSWLATGFPFTVALMVLKVVSLFLSTTPGGMAFLSHLVFVAPDSLSTPWTIFTYAVVAGGSFLTFLFHLGLTYWFCSSVERAWGTKNFALFFAAVTGVTALSLSLGAWMLHRPFGTDHLLPIAACALAWGLLNGDEAVSLFFIPMRGIHMAIIAVGYVMFEFAGGLSGWLAVPFALVGCGLAWLWVQRGWQYGFGTLLPNVARHTIKRPPLRLIPPPKAPKPKDDRFTIRDLNPLEWFAKRKRRKQFEKLMRDD